jgi:phage shock protein PspC (stress-responsive transcriptional regulator)
MIAGICSGLGYYSSIDPTVIRLLGVLLLFLTGPGIIAAYLIMAIIVLEEPKANKVIKSIWRSYKLKSLSNTGLMQRRY